jgi:hypothetical protein
LDEVQLGRCMDYAMVFEVCVYRFKRRFTMNLLSLLIAPLQGVVLFFAPHAVGAKPLGLRSTAGQVSPASPAQRTPQPVTPARNTPLGPHQPLARVSRITHPSYTSFVQAKPIHRVRVVRNVDTTLPAGRAGRMVMSGRFADVCAELDRMAAA